MGSSYNPFFNPHAPGPIGDTTASTVAATIITATRGGNQANFDGAAGGPFNGIPSVYSSGTVDFQMGNSGGPILVISGTGGTVPGALKYIGCPTTSTGLVSGQIYSNAGILTRVP